MFVIIPGLGIPASFYEKFALALAGQGASCLVLELRGQGASNVKPGYRVNFGYSDLMHDLDELLDAARENDPEAPVYLFGHSLGGQLALMHAARYPGKVDRLLFVASGSPHWRNYQGKTRWKIRMAPMVFRLMGGLFGYVPGRLVGFGGNEARGVMADWSVLVLQDRIDPYNDDFDYESAFRSLTLPIDAFVFDTDWLAPGNVACELVKRCPDADLDVQILRSETLNFTASHFNWVHQPEELLPLFLQRIRQD